MKLSNTARSMSEIAPQASIFIPMTMPSVLPSYTTLDMQSQWHRSALFATAMESVTLPSRLRSHHGARQTLDQLVSALNINGNQNIAKIRMSIDQANAQNGDHRPSRLEVQGQSRDLRLPSQSRVRHADEFAVADAGEGLKIFDIDFFPTETGEQGRGRQSSKKTHVFGQAENYRTGEISADENDVGDEDVGHERARRRAAGLPIIQRSVQITEVFLSVAINICFIRFSYPRRSPSRFWFSPIHSLSNPVLDLR